MRENVLLYFIYLRLKFIYILLILLISIHDLRNMNVYLSEIKLVIKGKGNHYFLYNNFNPEPSEVIINNDIKDSGIKCYTFTEELNTVVIKFNKSITSCENMFYGLANITEIDLSNFDTSKVVSMGAMFYLCSNLERIYFGNINTSSVKRINNLFSRCTKLTSIDVSNFNTSSVTTISSMFQFCESLTSIDVSNFDTHNVEDMFDMFAYCSNLITANVSNFNTSKVKNMQGIFYKCYKLKYLDLSSLDTSSATNAKSLFTECNSLVYIKLNSFEIKNTTIFNYMFSNVSPNLKICIDDNTTKSQLQSINAIFDCSDKCFDNDIKVDYKNNLCIKNCNESENKYELNNLCYEICPNTSYLSNDNEYICLDKSSEDNYYFDNDKNLYKKCYNTCKKCNK